MHPSPIERARELAATTDAHLPSSTYSTAWAARNRCADGSVHDADAVRWLRRHQRPDGSWGGRIARAHDRIVCTLAATVALAELPHPDAAVADEVARGCDHLQRHAGDRHDDAAKTLAFDLVVPSLVERGRELGLPLPADLDLVRAARDAKLQMVPREVLVRHPTTLLYSLESVQALFGSETARFRSPDGSIAGSPSATAAHWAATGDPQAAAYLATTRNADGGYPEFHPLDVFSRAWTLYHLQRAGLTTAAPELGAETVRWLDDLLGRGRSVGFGTHFPLPDPDSTAMCLNVLAAAGVDVADRVDPLLREFEGPSAYLTYPFERTVSVTSNARVLLALHIPPVPPAAQVSTVVDFLMDARRDGAWWQDKWQISPYYATATTASALVRAAATTGPVSWSPTLEWLRDTQHDDGSWGADGGNPEETAYAVLALDTLAPPAPDVRLPDRTWPAAARYLEAHLDDTDLPELWVGKGLYAPTTVARSAVLAASVLASSRQPSSAQATP